MSVEEALVELKVILGKGLYPLAVPKVREILVRLERSARTTQSFNPPPEEHGADHAGQE
jgi:hypothetical protein